MAQNLSSFTKTNRAGEQRVNIAQAQQSAILYDRVFETFANELSSRTNQQVSKEDVYNMFIDGFRTDNRVTSARGSVRGEMFAPKIVSAFKNADVRTAVHELAHTFEDHIDIIDQGARQTVLDAFNKFAEQNGLERADSWGTTQAAFDRDNPSSNRVSEWFARNWEQYFQDGTLPEGAPNALRRTFDRFTNWLRSIGDVVFRDSGQKIKLDEVNPELRNLFDKILTNEPNIQESDGTTTRQNNSADVNNSNITDQSDIGNVRTATNENELQSGVSNVSDNPDFTNTDNNDNVDDTNTPSNDQQISQNRISASSLNENPYQKIIEDTKAKWTKQTVSDVLNKIIDDFELRTDPQRQSVENAIRVALDKGLIIPNQIDGINSVLLDFYRDGNIVADPYVQVGLQHAMTVLTREIDGYDAQIDNIRNQPESFKLGSLEYQLTQIQKMRQQAVYNFQRVSNVFDAVGTQAARVLVYRRWIGMNSFDPVLARQDLITNFTDPKTGDVLITEQQLNEFDTLFAKANQAAQELKDTKEGKGEEAEKQRRKKAEKTINRFRKQKFSPIKDIEKRVNDLFGTRELFDSDENIDTQRAQLVVDMTNLLINTQSESSDSGRRTNQKQTIETLLPLINQRLNANYTEQQYIEFLAAVDPVNKTPELNRRINKLKKLKSSVKQFNDQINSISDSQEMSISEAQSLATLRHKLQMDLTEGVNSNLELGNVDALMLYLDNLDLQFQQAYAPKFRFDKVREIKLNIS